jgi:asparagine synthase (glutamine-hydrolysing)
MSGIAGIFFRDGRPVESVRLQKMSAAMAHRGPHGDGVWTRGSTGFAHRQLHTCPEGVQERQPLADRAGELCLVFDGRIDNRDELFSELKISHDAWISISDTVLLLAAYRNWGKDCATKLQGDYAFAVWDAANQSVFCARDAMGIKPLYYYLDEKKFIFASEIQALFASGAIDRSPNLPLLARHLTGDFSDAEQTRYANVLRLPARHSLSVAAGTFAKRKYWDFDPARNMRCKTDTEYAEQFREVFFAAVRARLRSRTPVGARLSGGLDSSSVFCVARREISEHGELTPALETFSNVFDGLPCDERQYIEAVIAESGAKPNFFPFQPEQHETPSRFAEMFPDNLYHPGMAVNVAMCRNMQERGFHVAFEGIGGDELLAPGCQHVTDLVAERKWKAAWREMKAIDAQSGYSKWDLVYSYALIPFVPGIVKPVLRPLHGLMRGKPVESCVRGDFLNKMGVEKRSSDRTQLLYTTRAQQKIYDVLYSGWNALIAVEEIESFNARFGIEVRYPLLDRRVAEFVIALPAEQRWRGQSKFILREAMAGVLPEPVRIRRGKAEFSPLIRKELTGANSASIRAAFASSQLAEAGMVDRAKLLNLFDSHKARPNYRDAGRLIFLAGMEMWFRQMTRGSKFADGADGADGAKRIQPEAGDRVLTDSVM